LFGDPWFVSFDPRYHGNDPWLIFDDPRLIRSKMGLQNRIDWFMMIARFLGAVQKVQFLEVSLILITMF